MARTFALLLLIASPLAAEEVSPDAPQVPPNQNLLAERLKTLQASFEELQPAPTTLSQTEEPQQQPPDCEILSEWCPNGPKWTVRGGVVILDREEDDGSFGSFDTGVGPYFSALRSGRDIDLEFIYFGVDNWDSRIDNPITVVRAAELHSVELNLRHGLRPWLTFVTGARWFALEESTRAGPGGMIVATTFADNDLFGWQFGLDASVFRRERFSLDILGKLGVFGVSAEQSATGIPIRLHGGHTSFAGDLWISGAYRLTERLSVRGGYQLVYFDDLARPALALDNTDLLVHGGHVLLEGRF